MSRRVIECFSLFFILALNFV